MKKIIITGSSGFIGSSVLKFISRAYLKAEIIALYNRNKPKFESGNISSVQINLCNKDEYIKLPKDFDAVIHLAGDKKTFLKRKESLNQFNDNITMTDLLAKHVNNSSCNTFIFSSSVYVYSGRKTLPFSEDNITIPDETLGTSKLACETLLKTYALNNCFNCLCLRLFTAYGPGSPNDQFIPTAIDRITKKDNIAKFGNPDILRDFVYVDNIANCVALSLDAMKNKKLGFFDVVNVATGVSTKIRDVVDLIVSVVGSNKKIIYDNKLLSKKGDSDHVVNIDKLKSMFGWVPDVKLKTGIENILKGIN